MYPRTEYEMTEEDFKTLMEAMKPVPMIMLQCGNPPSQQENANRAWAALGAKMGFDSDTVQPVHGKGQRVFSAVPCEHEDARKDRLAREAEEKREKEIALLTAEIAEREQSWRHSRRHEQWITVSVVNDNRGKSNGYSRRSKEPNRRIGRAELEGEKPPPGCRSLPHMECHASRQTAGNDQGEANLLPRHGRGAIQGSQGIRGGGMSEKPESDPAFPTAVLNGEAYSGMTLRDYFAAAALRGMLASGHETAIEKASTAAGGDPIRGLALASYGMADAMLAERHRD
jgi:hypothetical protein